MRNTTGTPKAYARFSRIALALAVLAGGLSCAWTVAQNTQVVAPAAAPTSASVANPATVGTPAAPAAAAGASHPAKSATKTAVRKPDNKLAWANLSQAQHEALEPLTGEWPRMSELQKEKWLEIGKRYTRMKPEEQQRLHERMRDWVKLTPAQRSAARTNYARAKKLDAEEKHEQWTKYQQLSEEQKKKLAEAKLPRRVAKLPTTPAAAAPSIQLPAEALDRPLPVVPAPTPAAAPAPALVPGSQAIPVPALAPTAAAPTTVAVSAAATSPAVMTATSATAESK
ncbi:DUF3106 domain-containing protein [Herbaspirillum sp. AP02]|uniref:DUF3106 domain-containing protein n=1 Tax=unclassified Herbaspirillum TaxID=2624150 RepID=UPI0015D98A16|nr:MULTISPECIES: DUF3106 domain-containing protein [unclassified Herbaspirillum]MBG7618732.1 DUF3106 domain-containing protein [Herbaspirillum sp. AP02]NZD67466.1 DUF3106 domain-containing protein [Herbaspirillum sp. AP21]